jgi:hypothetical protein
VDLFSDGRTNTVLHLISDIIIITFIIIINVIIIIIIIIISYRVICCEVFMDIK